MTILKYSDLVVENKMFQNQITLDFKMSVIIVLHSCVIYGCMFSFVLAHLLRESHFWTSETYFWM